MMSERQDLSLVPSPDSSLTGDGATGHIRHDANESSSARTSSMTYSDPARDNTRPAVRLSSRAMDVLGWLYRFRLLTTDQLERLHVPNGPPASRRRLAQMLLRRLVDDGLVVRLGRRIGSTRRGCIYGLTARGVATLGLPGLFGKRRRRVWTGKPYFQDHMLAVAETYVRVVEACREGPTELLGFDAEPAAWRRFPGPGGEVVTLKPDGLSRIATGKYELHCFVEVDLGTESLPTVQRKCRLYSRYFQTGLEQQRNGVFPRVVWLAPDQKRVRGIALALQRLSGVDARLFTVALQAHGPAILTTLPEDAAHSGDRP